MGQIVPVSALSLDGWVTSSASKADYLLSHFFLSEYSQTQLYKGNVTSLQYLIQKYQVNPNILERETQATLEGYFSRYFPNVQAEVVCEPNTTNSSQINLKIYISIQDESGATLSVGRLVDVLDSKINKIITYNNTGA